jgi:hypothetical protein
MTQARNVPKAVLFKLIKSKKPFGYLGLVFTVLSLLIFLPVTLIMSSSFSQPHEKYDFNAIEKNGKAMEATVDAVEIMGNVTVNGQNPRLIIYTYITDGQAVTDKFQTFDLDKADNLNQGDKIMVKVYNGQSVIADIKPYRFPYAIMLAGPLMFIVIGSIFLLIALIPALKKYKLYKTGIVKDAEIISMAPTGFGVRGMHRQSLLVNYFFMGRNGTKVFGESVTDEYSLLHEKKSGDTVKVFVSGEDESKSCLVPKLESLKYGWKL